LTVPPDAAHTTCIDDAQAVAGARSDRSFYPI